MAHDDRTRPSTETEATPKPPDGQNIKNLVTPGDDADVEAEAEREEPKEANPDPGEAPEEERSPT
jgi:hypothetical protein